MRLLAVKTLTFRDNDMQAACSNKNRSTAEPLKCRNLFVNGHVVCPASSIPILSFLLLISVFIFCSHFQPNAFHGDHHSISVTRNDPRLYPDIFCKFSDISLTVLKLRDSPGF